MCGECSPAVGEGDDALLSEQVLESLILWVDGNGGVTRYRLRPCGCHFQPLSAVSQRILESVQPSCLLAIFNLQDNMR
jgi:hypothetical protein